MDTGPADEASPEAGVDVAAESDADVAEAEVTALLTALLTAEEAEEAELATTDDTEETDPSARDDLPYHISTS